MTRVQEQRDERGICGIRVSGHSGYAAAGSDIVCAAASVLITTCANALTSVAKVCPILSSTEEPPVISVALPDETEGQKLHDAQIILRSAMQGFRDIAAEYPRYLQII